MVAAFACVPLDALVVSAAQLEMLTAVGGTKSLSAAVNESDERLLR
jgi:hypothetical protein